MPLPSLRRKSRPANTARSQATGDTSFPAGEASPVFTDGPEPVLTPYMQPRPRSSWYSQGSISYASPDVYMNSEVPPPLPMQLSASAPTPLTPTALRSLDEAGRRAASEEWEDDTVPESPRGTQHSSPNPYMSRKQHTAVSEYLRERAWVPATPTPSHTPPMPTSTPPPVPVRESSVFSRFSLASDGDRPLSRRTSRRESIKSKRSSITTLPYRTFMSEHEQWRPVIPVTPVQPTKSVTETTSSKFSNPFSFSTKGSGSRTKTSTTAASPAAPTPVTDPFISTPYEETHRGRSPIPVTTLHAFDHQVQNKGVANTALIRGLSQKYRPQPQPAHTHYQPAQYPRHISQNDVIPNRFDSMAIASQHQNHSRATAPATYKAQLQPHPRTQAQNLLHPESTGMRILNVRTRDPAENSDEGSWLWIGTMRGPEPRGVRLIDEMMRKSLEKKGTTEKGIKDIRKVLKHEGRGTIEWIEVYLRMRWGVEV